MNHRFVRQAPPRHWSDPFPRRRVPPTPHRDFACSAEWYRPQNAGVPAADWPKETAREVDGDYRTLMIDLSMRVDEREQERS